MRSKLASRLALVVAIGLLAGGCGDSDGEPDGEVKTTTADPEPATAAGDDAGADTGDQRAPKLEHGPEAKVDRTVRAFLRAALNGDGGRACELLSKDGKASVEASLRPTADGPADCAETFELIAAASGQTIRLGEEEVTAADVDSLELTVDIASDGRTAEVFAKDHRQPASLVRERGGWKLNWE